MSRKQNNGFSPEHTLKRAKICNSDADVYTEILNKIPEEKRNPFIECFKHLIAYQDNEVSDIPICYLQMLISDKVYTNAWVQYIRSVYTNKRFINLRIIDMDLIIHYVNNATNDEIEKLKNEKNISSRLHISSITDLCDRIFTKIKSPIYNNFLDMVSKKEFEKLVRYLSRSRKYYFTRYVLPRIKMENFESESDFINILTFNYNINNRYDDLSFLPVETLLYKYQGMPFFLKLLKKETKIILTKIPDEYLKKYINDIINKFPLYYNDGLSPIEHIFTREFILENKSLVRSPRVKLSMILSKLTDEDITNNFKDFIKCVSDDNTGKYIFNEFKKKNKNVLYILPMYKYSNPPIEILYQIDKPFLMMEFDGIKVVEFLIKNYDNIHSMIRKKMLHLMDEEILFLKIDNQTIWKYLEMKGVDMMKAFPDIVPQEYISERICKLVKEYRTLMNKKIPDGQKKITNINIGKMIDEKINIETLAIYLFHNPNYIIDSDILLSKLNDETFQYILSILDFFPSHQYQDVRDKCNKYFHYCNICLSFNAKHVEMHIATNNIPHTICVDCFKCLIKKDVCPYCRSPTYFHKNEMSVDTEFNNVVNGDDEIDDDSDEESDDESDDNSDDESDMTTTRSDL